MYLVLKDVKRKDVRKWVKALPVLMILIGFSRIYLMVHWTTDVLAGFALGTAILITGIQVYEKTVLKHDYFFLKK